MGIIIADSTTNELLQHVSIPSGISVELLTHAAIAAALSSPFILNMRSLFLPYQIFRKERDWR